MNTVTSKTTQTRIFYIVVTIVAILFIILFAINAYQWNKIRNSLTETTPVSRNEANVQFWLNIIWIIIGLALLAGALVALFTPVKVNKVLVNTATNRAHVVSPSVNNTTTPLYTLQKTPINQFVSS